MHVFRILFKTRNISKVAEYVRGQMQRLTSGMPDNLADLVFSREVKVYADEARLPPAATVAKRSSTTALYGERVPFLACYTGDGNRLIDWVVSPLEMRRRKLAINHEYYASKCLIPVLSRTFSLMGVDVGAWWHGGNPAAAHAPSSKRQFRGLSHKTTIAMPFPVNDIKTSPSCDISTSSIRNPVRERNSRQEIMDSFVAPITCTFCGHRQPEGVCKNIECDPVMRAARVLSRRREFETELQRLAKPSECNYAGTSHAANSSFDGCCESIHCPYYWPRTVAVIRNSSPYGFDETGRNCLQTV